MTVGVPGLRLRSPAITSSTVLCCQGLSVPREAHIHAEVLEQPKEVSSGFCEKNQVVELLNPVAFLQRETGLCVRWKLFQNRVCGQLLPPPPISPAMGFGWPGFSGVLQTLSHTAQETTRLKRHLVVVHRYFILIRQSLLCSGSAQRWAPVITKGRFLSLLPSRTYGMNLRAKTGPVCGRLFQKASSKNIGTECFN